MYICYHCIDYTTESLSDLIRHFKRTRKCNSSTMYNYEDCKKLSRRQYIFTFDISNLSKQDYIYIITHYCEKKNMIHSNFRNSTNLREPSENDSSGVHYGSLQDQTSESLLYDIHEGRSNEITSPLTSCSFGTNNEPMRTFKAINPHEVSSPLGLEESVEKQRKSSGLSSINTDNLSKSKIENISDLILNNDRLKDIFTSSYLDIMSKYKSNMNSTVDHFKKVEEDPNKNENESESEMSNIYYCYKCDESFSNKGNLKRHLQNSKACVRKQKEKEIFEKNKNENKMIQQRESINQNIMNTYVDNSNKVNIQNNNNNNNTNVYNFQIKDFIHDRYDISHIKNNFYEKKDFFIYHNFLRVIMENKKNQNIFFINNEAIVYTDNELCKMTSDKAGYLILDKLNQSFQQLINKQDDEAKKYYDYISNYYRILLGHYKHDTIHKEYNVDERRFVYTANSSMFRSRDKYLTKIISTLDKYKNDARENMFIGLNEIKDIPMMNPNIEDFASIKMRYRDLRDKN